MQQVIEVFQPISNNLIRVYTEGNNKRLEVLASYRDEEHFSIRLTHAEAEWVASGLESSRGKEWKRLENEQILRVLKSGEVRQLVLSDVKGDREVQSGKIGVVFEDVIDKVADALRHRA